MYVYISNSPECSVRMYDCIVWGREGKGMYGEGREGKKMYGKIVWLLYWYCIVQWCCIKSCVCMYVCMYVWEGEVR